jgi:hypothetical protein
MVLEGSTPAASTMPLSINYLQTLKFFKKLDSQSIVIFRTWVAPVGYTSRESLNRHYFLVCNDALHHLHPLRPEDRENRVTPTSKTLAQQQDGRRRGPAFRHRRIVENHSQFEVIAAGLRQRSESLEVTSIHGSASL